MLAQSSAPVSRTSISVMRRANLLEFILNDSHGAGLAASRRAGLHGRK
jgi:hypothetical protein